MEEMIFFNRGNALAAKRDPKELMQEVQVTKDKRPPFKNLIIVEDQNKGEYILFDLADQEEESATTEMYHVVELLDKH